MLLISNRLFYHNHRAYNGASLLPRLLQSLTEQICHDFMRPNSPLFGTYFLPYREDVRLS